MELSVYSAKIHPGHQKGDSESSPAGDALAVTDSGGKTKQKPQARHPGQLR